MTEQEERDTLSQYPSSVLERGYGTVGKLVMQDRRLSIYAKAIYAYLCTFGNVAFPGRAKICSDLDINESTYKKHMNLLLELGYISILQKRKEGKFQRNEYIINVNPQEILKRREAQKPRNEAVSTVGGETTHGENQAEEHRGWSDRPRSHRPRPNHPHNITRPNNTRINKTTTAATEIETREDRAPARTHTQEAAAVFSGKTKSGIAFDTKATIGLPLEDEASEEEKVRRTILESLAEAERERKAYLDALKAFGISEEESRCIAFQHEQVLSKLPELERARAENPAIDPLLWLIDSLKRDCKNPVRLEIQAQGETVYASILARRQQEKPQDLEHQKGAGSKQAAPATPPERPEISQEQYLSKARLQGVDDESAMRFLKQFGQEKVLEKLPMLQAARKVQEIENPGGWLYRALEKDYQRPQKQVSEKERKLQEAAKRMTEQIAAEKAGKRLKREEPKEPQEAPRTTEELRRELRKLEESIAEYTKKLEESPWYQTPLTIAKKRRRRIQELLETRASPERAVEG